MNRVFRTAWLAVVAWLVSTVVVAETTEPEIGIVNRTDCGGFWRYDFNYETVDADGETPIVLSAAIFMTPDVHDKTVKAKGCGLLNHYTITTDKQCPTHVSSGFTIEGILANSNYIMIESDGFGFGLDVEHNQKYLQGRATARVNIDAFLAGRKLLEEEGYEWSNVTLNLGYSQGGNSGMWVNRLVAEGYRGDELPKIDYCIIGGGPYDMYAHYRKLAEENLTQYPVALPLIFSGMIDAGGYKVKNEDIFTDELVSHLPELFDTKLHSTDYINDFIYELYGHAEDRKLPIDQMVKPAFFDENSEVMKEIIYHLKQNSLVYDSWKPEKTDHITFVHSQSDEVVPYLNQEHMESHLLENGYDAFDTDNSSEDSHTDTGIYYVLKAITLLSTYIPSGMENVFREIPGEQTHDIYSLDGRLVRKQTTLSEAYRSLPKGIYVINGRKIVKQ
ncbi:MAG: hypothetical protein ACI3YD_00410 [Alloprevotella sp.]